jgi:hypothetical protein
MEETEARATVEHVIEEIAKSLALADVATKRAAGLKKLLTAYVEMFPALAPMAADALGYEPRAEGDEAPKGAEAVRLVMHERPGYRWLVSELVDELRGQGWLPTSDNPANAVRTALERLAAVPESSDVYKSRINTRSGTKVVYCYDPDRAPSERPAPALVMEPPGEYRYEEEPF